jgi:hypothetical protein
MSRSWLAGAALAVFGCGIVVSSSAAELSTDQLRDKIKGGWAAQTIGVTYGHPVEFRFNSVRVPDDHVLPWHETYLHEVFTEKPFVYDDIYMDLTFVQVFEDKGFDAPVQAFADAFANADYSLWFANQVARYNVLNGIAPPASGHWLNNPAADDIDFQIEADFAGLMAPGMVNTAVEISDKVGHIMNYGDGWYGGVFVAAMYSLAFVQDDVEEIVRQAIEVIPEQSDFHKIIDEVIALHEQNPDDWKHAWEGINARWAQTDLGPTGLLNPFNIDAKINAAWVVLGLLYGDGDFGRTMEIATRAGDDADCNPASAAGILGTIYGYEAIPAFWKQGLAEIEQLDFAYTTISLEKAYDLSYRHALAMVRRGGGEVTDDQVTILVQDAQTVDFEEAFAGHYPQERMALGQDGEPMTLDGTYQFEFDGVGFALMGEARLPGGSGPFSVAGNSRDDHYEFVAELHVDGELIETARWPTNYTTRRFYLFWKYALEDGPHRVEVKLLNPTDKAQVVLQSIAIYGSTPPSAG